MHSNNSSNYTGECFIPWDSVRAYGALLMAQSDDYSNRLNKVKFQEID